MLEFGVIEAQKKGIAEIIVRKRRGKDTGTHD